MSAAVRDSQRAQVYRADHALAWIYDHTTGGLSVEVAGVPLQLEPEARFGDLAAIQAYVDRVTLNPAVIARFGITGKVVVRERKGAKSAHYQLGEIAVHTAGTNHHRWAMRELVILHELAHHFDRGPGHGPSFATTFIDLLELVMGPQVSLALALLYQQEGVQTQ